MLTFSAEHERLPIGLGWTKPKKVISMTDLLDMLDRVVNATEELPQKMARHATRGDFHVGL